MSTHDVMAALTEIRDSVRIHIPKKHHRPIAVIGAGAIVEVAHLPAYRAHGLPVKGIFDLDADRARRVAHSFDVPHVYASLDELLADDEVEVVDIGVVPHAQPPIARQALQAGKHLLCQKPLALDIEEAEELAALALRYNRKLAVNQQLRFDEGIAVARSILRQGWLGDPTMFSVHVDIRTDFSEWGWLAEIDELELRYHSIHYFDAIRSIFGEPHTVFCSAGRTPGQKVKGETRTISTLAYADGRQAFVHANHENRWGDPQASFRIDGSQGALRGTFGLLANYPHGGPDQVEFISEVLPTDGWVPYPVSTRWIPDAFAGTMSTLLAGIATDTDPVTTGEENLGTIRLLEALYRSAHTGRSIQLGPPAAGSCVAER